MSTALSPESFEGPLPDLLGRFLSETAQRDLQALRAELDARYQALESALSDPNAAGGLEQLILDLARVATDEAEAASRHSILEAQLETLSQTSAARTVAQRSTETHRAALASLRSELDQARSELDTERATSAPLRSEVDRLHHEIEAERGRTAAQLHHGNQLQAALDAELAAGAALRSEIERLRHEIETERARATTELQHREQLQGALDSERSANLASRTTSDTAQAALNDERAASAALREDLGRAREALLHEQAAATDRQRSSGEMQGALDAERLVNVALRQSVDDLERRASAAENAMRDEVHAISERLAAERLEAQSAAATLRDTLTASQGDFATAHAQVAALAAEVAAAATRADLSEQNRRVAEQARDEAQARLAAILADNGANAEELEKTRHAIAAAQAASAGETDALHLKCRLLEESQQKAETLLEARTREYEARVAELDAQRQRAAGDAETMRRKCEGLERALREAPTSFEVASNDPDGEEAGAIEPDIAPRSFVVADVAMLDEGEEIHLDDLPDLDADADSFDIELPADATANLDAVERPTESLASPYAHRAESRPEIQIDGIAASVVDLSATGAQVLSPAPLKPNRLVNVVLPFENQSVSCKAKILWAQLEPPSSAEATLQFRAGLSFSDVDEPALKALIDRAGHAVGQ